MGEPEAVIPTEQLERVLERHDYTYKQPIGAGGSASVHVIWSKRYDRAFAAKVAKLSKNEVFNQMIDAEVIALKQLEHPNIIQMYDHFVDEGLRFIVLEYCPLGSLEDIVKNTGRMDRLEVHRHFREVASALKDCHYHGIAHRDIKPANVMVDVNGRPKLGDFGLGIEWKPGEMMHNTAGSLLFSPPELLMGKKYDPFKADVWSLGVSLYILLSGESPFTGSTKEAVASQIRQGISYFSPTKFAKDEIALLFGMLTVDPARRATMVEVMESKWVTTKAAGGARRPVIKFNTENAAGKGIGVQSQASSLTLSMRGLPQVVPGRRRSKAQLNIRHATFGGDSPGGMSLAALNNAFQEDA